MGWNDRDERWNDLADEADGIAEYYSEMTGKNIRVEIVSYEEFFIETPRTNGKEYVSSLRDADRRLKQLYEDILPDDGDTTDPYEGL
jgi:hypothetical protein